jgi:hypothetical protein
VVSQKFENCTIEIDASGNVFITAKGYKVEAAPSQAGAIQPVSKHYWLVTEKPSPGMDQYDLDISINGQFLRRVTSREEGIYLDITRYMHGGKNAIRVVATKNIGNERKSSSPYHYSRLIIGEGEETGRTIMIDKQLLDYRRTAAEVQNFADVFTVDGR